MTISHVHRNISDPMNIIAQALIDINNTLSYSSVIEYAGAVPDGSVQLYNISEAHVVHVPRYGVIGISSWGCHYFALPLHIVVISGNFLVWWVKP